MTADHNKCCADKGWCRQPGALLKPETKVKLETAWKRLLGGKIPPAQVAFPLEARRDILEALDCCSVAAADSPAKAERVGTSTLSDTALASDTASSIAESEAPGSTLRWMKPSYR